MGIGSALTTVTLKATSVVNESTLAGVSGQFRRGVELEIDHSFRRYLIGGVDLFYGITDYVGSPRRDTSISAAVTLVYKFTRTVQFKGEFRRLWFRSTEPGNDYTANTFLVGLRLQR